MIRTNKFGKKATKNGTRRLEKGQVKEVVFESFFTVEAMQNYCKYMKLTGNGKRANGMEGYWGRV